MHVIYPHTDVRCEQGDCPKICSSFCNLKRHIVKHHQELYDFASVPPPVNVMIVNTEDVDTEHKQLAYLKQQQLYIEPVSVGVRKESRKSTLSGNREMKNVVDTAQYAPIEILLARIMIEYKNISLNLNCHIHASNGGNDYFNQFLKIVLQI